MGPVNSQVVKSRHSIVSTKELAKQLFRDPVSGKAAGAYELRKDVHPKLKILDSSEGGAGCLGGFEKTAIPTARLLNLQDNLKDTTTGLPNSFPTPEIVRDVLGEIGIEKDDKIVVYNQPGKFSGATRAHFILSRYGFDAWVLDGGLRKYMTDGYPTEEGKVYTGEKTNIKGLTDPRDSIAFFDEIKEFEQGKKKDMQVIDLRPAFGFNGEDPEPFQGCRQGSVKGSINIEYKNFFNEDSTFINTEQLKELFMRYNLDTKKHTIFMCKTGMLATIGALVAGSDIPSKLPFEKIQLYDGSWSEYGSLN
ncbi:unnamed protein product [Moneuplotes crassus]|uniref:Rhodanese domain-containing protein n=1 Tax=Euplotes crassus TaxID=5936 RepID=A0AAD2D153_EUPCR|nr:unnamed protein product [Moneuplotes crassus]